MEAENNFEGLKVRAGGLRAAETSFLEKEKKEKKKEAGGAQGGCKALKNVHKKPAAKKNPGSLQSMLLVMLEKQKSITAVMTQVPCRTTPQDPKQVNLGCANDSSQFIITRNPPTHDLNIETYAHSFR